MLYREYGQTKKFISAIGFGSTRFKDEDLDDQEGLIRCAELVYNASEYGVNYFDIASNYAKSQCEEIYRIAFKMMKRPYFVTSKSSSFQDNTADDVLRRIENSLRNMDVKKIDFFYIWSVMNELHFKDIMKKGGAYEGAYKAKERGLIDHIVFSNHASTEVALKIISESIFEGITISYNLLNFKQMEPIIKAAASKQMGITVMNPLAGGIIPQNETFFKGVKLSKNENISQATLKFIYSNPEVTSILSGISTKEEVQQNCDSLSNYSEIGRERLEVVKLKMEEINGLCTGCGYCRDLCPQSILISDFMQAYNMRFFQNNREMYGRTNKDLIKRISIIRKLNMDFNIQPQDDQNPCIQCGKCEAVCTQHLPIINIIQEMYQIIRGTGAASNQYKDRLNELINCNNYQKVAFYTAGGYTARVIEIYKQFFGEPKFEVIVFDSNTNRWGDKISGYDVLDPNLILDLKPDCIIISNYNYADEIYEGLKKYESNGIAIMKLHKDEDVPWVF